MRILLLALFVIITQLQAYTQSKIKVACVGNSITEGRRIEEGKRYPDSLQNLLGNRYEVRNYGLGGRTLLKKGDQPYWNEEKYKEVLAWMPDIVVIKLGTNDSKPQNWQHKDNFESDYREMIQAFRSLPGKREIYICYPIPVFQDAWGIRESVVKNEIIPIVQRVAEKEKVKVIDLYKPLVGKGDLAPDGIHPLLEGSAIIAREVYQAIK